MVQMIRPRNPSGLRPPASLHPQLAGLIRSRLHSHAPGGTSKQQAHFKNYPQEDYRQGNTQKEKCSTHMRGRGPKYNGQLSDG